MGLVSQNKLHSINHIIGKDIEMWLLTNSVEYLSFSFVTLSATTHTTQCPFI